VKRLVGCGKNGRFWGGRGWNFFQGDLAGEERGRSGRIGEPKGRKIHGTFAQIGTGERKTIGRKTTTNQHPPKKKNQKKKKKTTKENKKKKTPPKKKGASRDGVQKGVVLRARLEGGSILGGVSDEVEQKRLYGDKKILR